MSIEYFFNSVNDTFGINANAALYVAPSNVVSLANYDFVIKLTGQMNDYFNTKTYQQNSLDINAVNIKLETNNDFYNIGYFNTTMSLGTFSFNDNGIETYTSFNTRILEILALKIFGHARARAAISNDTEITVGIQSNLQNHIITVLNTHSQNIFNQYVNQDLPELNQNDINQPVNFNFQNDVFSFPGYIVGSLIDKQNLSNALLNGVAGGFTDMVNGDYNIPILIRIGNN